MHTILITGSEGFVGRNLRMALTASGEWACIEYDKGSASGVLEKELLECRAIVHLAGVNRPKDEGEYITGNVGLTEQICDQLEKVGRRVPILFASSIQAELDNAYGRSKRQAEDRLARYSNRMGAAVVVFRFKNLFGKWCRPNYNSVVATFCHNVAHGLRLTTSDPARELELVHIDDVVRAIVRELRQILDVEGSGEVSGHGISVGNAVSAESPAETFRFASVSPVFRISLGRLATLITGFRESRQNLILPDVGDPFIHALYSTYLSYVPPGDFGYGLAMRHDNRGALAEFVRTRSAGQMFVSRTKPGIERGHHYHHTKTEKFLVLEGRAVIRFRLLGGDTVIERPVSGEIWEVVDIPPGYTHSIQNVGTTDLVTLFWASETFNPDKPDTYPEGV